MRIWIDGYEANQANRVGSGQYAFEILRNLEKISSKGRPASGRDSDNEYTILLPAPPLSDLPKERPNWKYEVLKPNKLWTRIALPLALFKSKQKPDVFFSPTHYIPRFFPSKVKMVCTIFDLSYLYFKEMFKKDDLYKLTNWSKFSIENSDQILAISEFTKQDILKNYSVKPDKITVTLLSYDKEIYKPIKDQKKIKQLQEKYKISGDYIIYIGTLQPRKNLIRLIEAMKYISNVKLVVVGKISGPGRSAWMFDEILSKPKELGIEDRIIFTNFVPSEELAYLISGAKIQVYPSLYDGFGITPLESMACGIPVALSNATSLPEVVGGAGTYFDPMSCEDIAKAANSLLNDEKLRQKKVQLSLDRVKHFSWEKCARETLAVFKKLTGESVN